MSDKYPPEGERDMFFSSPEERIKAREEEKGKLVSVKTVQDKEHALLVHLERIKAAVSIVRCRATPAHVGDTGKHYELMNAATDFLLKQFKGE